MHKTLKPKNWKGEHYKYRQHKLDGHRYTFYMSPSGRLQGWGRTYRSDLEISVKRPSIKNCDWWYDLQQIPIRSAVDGELIVLDGNSGDVATALAEDPTRLIFVPFAVPYWNDQLLHHEDVGVGMSIALANGLGFVKTYLDEIPLDRESLLSGAEELGIEGWVLKRHNYTDWWKLKSTKTIDLEVVGFKDGEGKYLGLVGALIVQAIIDGVPTELASISGMTDDVRYDIEDSDIGRVCEVEYQRFGKNRLIHPRFIRWRDDKPVEECAYSRSDL